MLLVPREGRLVVKILYAFIQRLTETHSANARGLNVKTRHFTPFPGALGPIEGTQGPSSGRVQVSFDAQKCLAKEKVGDWGVGGAPHSCTREPHAPPTAAWIPVIPGRRRTPPHRRPGQLPVLGRTVLTLP